MLTPESDYVNKINGTALTGEKNMDMKDKLIAELPAIHNYNKKMQSCIKPSTLEEICSMWDIDHLFIPSKTGTPDSVLAPLLVDSPPLDHTYGSLPLAPLHPDTLHFATSLFPAQHNEDFYDEDLASGDDHVMQDIDHVNYLSPSLSSIDSNGTGPSTKDGSSAAIESSAHAETEFVRIAEFDDPRHTEYPVDDHQHRHDMMQYADFDMITQRQLVIAPPCGYAAVVRQYVKQYLDMVFQEELAVCGCAHMIQKEKNDEDGKYFNPALGADHHLECKMRKDYAMWVMWMQERSMQNEGLDLVQRLLACAEAVACRDAHQARSLLQSVQELASPYGDSLQRVAFCFIKGLAARLDQHNVAGSSPSNQPFSTKCKSQSPPICAPHLSTVVDDVLQRQEAFHFMCDVCPYVPFGHFIANSVILEAIEGKEALHVIDLGMTEGLQWPALIHGLATRPGGQPKLLRITAVGTFDTFQMEEVGEALRHEAAAASLNFEFNAVHEPLENIAAADLDLRVDEIVVVNCVLRLHCVVKESRGSLNTVLHAIHGLSPKVLTLVEQDANHNGPFFLGRFMEALHYYSAIFDSLQTALPRHSTRRITIEQCHLAHEIGNIVACEGPTRVERHERVDQWRRRMSRAGFQLAPIRLDGQARHWLSTYYAAQVEDYTLSDEKGCLVLGWKGKPIIAASAWRC